MSKAPEPSNRSRTNKAALLLAIVLFSSIDVPRARAENYAHLLNMARDTQAGPSLTSEFIFRNDSEEALVPVFLLGAVSKPGLYHIPRNTDIVTLLTLAGGTLTEAQLDNIQIKNQSGVGLNRHLVFDMEKALRSEEPIKLALTSNDVVFVNPAKPWISSNVLTTVGLATGLLAIIVSGFLIKESLSK